MQVQERVEDVTQPVASIIPDDAELIKKAPVTRGFSKGVAVLFFLILLCEKVVHSKIDKP